jgi:pSer/pThr/pTyr-binding forkhead associated (FHA) protein
MRRFTLPPGESTIGRRSARKGIEPEVDLAGAQEDPAVSRAHAVVVVGDDGSCSLVDLGSTNGTWLSGADEPIERGVPVKLCDGATFHVGAWTAITVRYDDD